MPWKREAMKDVVWLRKASGKCLTTFDPGISEWGNPALSNNATCHLWRGRTRGSETSQYPKEKKTNIVSHYCSTLNF